MMKKYLIHLLLAAAILVQAVLPAPKAAEGRLPRTGRTVMLLAEEPVTLRLREKISEPEETPEPEEVPEDDAEAAAEETATYEGEYVPTLDGWTGDMGRVMIPELGYSAALQYSDGYDSQEIVDQRDSAAYLTCMSSVPIIADHCYQGFSVLANAVVGETKLYVVSADGSYDTYVCSDNYQGYGTDYTMEDSHGRDVLDRYGHGLLSYTCEPDWPYVRIVHWVWAE